MSSTQNRKGKQRKINSLPNEVLLEIFKNIDPTDLLQNLSLVSHRWRTVALDPTVWHLQSIRDKHIHDNLKSLYFAPILHEVNITASDPNSVYKALTHGHKDLKRLRVHFKNNCFSVTQICDLILKFPNLAKLEVQIPATTQDSEVFSALKSLKKLQELTLSGVVSDTQELMEALAVCESLRILDLSECRIVLHDHHLAWLFHLERAWHTLRLVTHFITEEGYTVIGPLASLRDLALVKCRNLSQVALEQLTLLTELRALAIKENCVLSANALTNFFNTATIGQLIKVDLTVYRADDDVALVIATRCINLMHLRIAMCLLTDRGVRDIVLNAPNLTHLDLEFNNIRGDALHLIPRHLRNLTYLNLHLCYNVHVNLLLLAQALPDFTIIDPTGFSISSAFSFDTLPTIYT